ncbi:MAG TPA: LURP-one-related family protein [Pirellulales bacterium]|nr:LURP-one-related family protein [Pirellulales bacterium]
MRKKLFSLGADFTIKDADGNDAFFVDGKVLSLRDRLIFEDMQGNELAVVQKKLLTWGPAYEIYHAGQLRAVVKEALFTLFGHRFSVDDEHGPDDLEARGNFSDHRYTFTRAEQAVAEVSESWFTIPNTYGVDIVDGQDDVLILACAVVIERCQEAASHR